MSVKTILKSIGAAIGFVALAAGGAFAQGCDIESLGGDNAEAYLEAENELVVNKNPGGALAKLNELRAKPLNCFEEGAVLGLSAQIKIAQNDYLGAAGDLETSLRKGYIPAENRANTLKALSQIYLGESRYETGLRYMNEWISAGGQPTRDEKYTLAKVYVQLERYREAVPWAEQVLQADGPNAKREIYDTLIYLYSNTGQLAKKAALLERLIEQDPTDKRLWQAIAGDYFQGNNERRAFEVQKTMYLGGILSEESEYMQVVNFYHQFDIPYSAARVLEKEMSAGRIERTPARVRQLAVLYQSAREHERAIPILTEAASLENSADLYIRLGRSYLDQKKWGDAETAFRSALDAGGLRNRGSVWVMIGQSRYNAEDRPGAREAFAQANNSDGRNWIGYMDSEERTAKLRAIEQKGLVLAELRSEQDSCERLQIIGGENLPEGCATVEARFDAQAEEIRIDREAL